MPRVVLVLLLALAVGVGVVGREACADDDCGMSDEGSLHGGADACPPLCGGCARVAALAAPDIVPIVAPQRIDRIVSPAPLSLPASPPRTGLFRPPRG